MLQSQYCSSSSIVVGWVVLQQLDRQYCSGWLGGTAEVEDALLQWFGGWCCSGPGCSTAAVRWVGGTAVVGWLVLQRSRIQYCSGWVGGTAVVQVAVLQWSSMQWLGGWYCSGTGTSVIKVAKILKFTHKLVTYRHTHTNSTFISIDVHLK